MTTSTIHARYDVVILGGGHNGLVSAAYLAQAGFSVLVLERQPVVGGAAISQPVFKGLEARLSRYAYLLSMFPQKIRDDLGLRFETRKRTVSSFTPVVQGGEHQALLIGSDAEATRESFRQITGGDGDYEGYREWYRLVEVFAERVWPTLLQPLPSRAAMQALFSDADGRSAWELLVEQPLGMGIEKFLQDDVVRGAVYTDAKIGTLSQPHQADRLQNRTYLYHVMGQGTGEWRVVVGGMGMVTGELGRTAREAGAEILTSATVTQVQPDGQYAVVFNHNEVAQTVQARYVLANVAPQVLSRLLPQGALPAPEAEGAAFKINMLFKRLPRPKAKGYTPQQAFTGTFHMDERYSMMQAAAQSAMNGVMPEQPPGEMYCQTMTDPSILSYELASAGYHTITLFGLDMPARLFRDDPVGARERALRRYMDAINRYIEEPLEECLATDADGKLCIEAKSAVDLDHDLGLPNGHIFHTDLSWPFAEDEAQAGSWGVETGHPNLFICGSGAARGGCVSGIPGYNAAMKVLECEGRGM